MADTFEKAKELRKLWSGFQGVRVLLTANNYRLFDYLEKQKTAKKLAGIIGTDERATAILLDALTGIGLLKKKKDMYLNSALAAKFLVSGKPYYQGDIIRHADVLWKNWSGLDEVLKTGKPYHKWHDQEAFILGMHNIAILKARDVLKEIGLKGVKTALDLGGGPGTYAMEMAKRRIHVTLFDRPETVKIAKRVINNPSLLLPLSKGRTGGVKGIDFISGDFLEDDFGKGYDLIFISQIMHAYSENECISVLRKCRNSLNNDGRVVIQEFFINEDLTYPSQSSLFSVNMLVNTDSGRCYSPQEMRNWFLKTGFRKVTKKFFTDSVLISALSADRQM